MNKNLKAVLLTVLTLSVFTLVIIELTGVSRNSLFRATHDGGEGVFYSKDGEVYHGEIYPEQIKHRDEVVAKMPKTTMQFYETNYNFGSISRGRIVKHTFRFKNTGMAPLMIAKTDVSCGCTVTDFPYDPIAPGLDGDLTIEFNSTGKSGYQHNNTIVHSNANPESVSIGIEADVN